MRGQLPALNGPLGDFKFMFFFKHANILQDFWLIKDLFQFVLGPMHGKLPLGYADFDSSAIDAGKI